MTPDYVINPVDVRTAESPALTDIKWALTRFTALRPDYQIARDYYDGKHRLAFASEKLSSAFGRLFKAFADNLCPTVVETVKDRLKLDGFDLKAAQASVNELWRRNRLKVRANQVHLDALVDGDAYVIVWPDSEGTPVFFPNRAGNIVIDYDDEQPGYITKAAKAWIDSEKRCRLTLYYRDRIEKYITRNKAEGALPDRAEAFERFQPASDSTWPLENSYDKVPIFHFNNRGSIGALGCSELVEAIPIQDALNKSIADMLVASEFYGVPQRWATGLGEIADLSYAEIKKRYALIGGGVWGTSSTEAEFGEFSAGDIAKYILVSENFRKEIARVTRTPLHYFSLEGSFPSGEALRTAEGPLEAKVEDRTDAWGAVWSDAMRFALQITGAGKHEPEPKWRNTATRDEKGLVERVATKHKDLQVPIETCWTELEYTEDQIAEMKALREAERVESLKRQQEMTKARGIVPPNSATNGESEVIQ